MAAGSLELEWGVSAAAPFASQAPSGSVAPKPSVFVLDPGLPRFALVLLCYVLGLATLATLSPFDFDLQHPHGYIFATSPTDVALNLAFLFPVGFLLRLARGDRAWPLALDSLALGVLVSCALELSQLFLPSRCTSPTDVLTNGVGAWAGGLAHARIGRYLDRRLQRQLSLHLPLANLLYLSVPLLSLDALSTYRWDACLPEIGLLLFIAEIAAGLYKHRLEGSGKPFANAFACVMGGVVGIGYMPIIVASPWLWVASILGMAALTRFVIAYGTRMPATERRFVAFTIQRAAPFFLLYVLLLGSHGWIGDLWPASDALVRSFIHGAQIVALSLLRDVTAFTLLGYLGSELQARSSDAPARIFGRVLSVGVPVALFVGGVRADALTLAAIGRVALFVLGVVAGGLIHRAQLRLVHSWSRTTHRPSK